MGLGWDSCKMRFAADAKPVVCGLTELRLGAPGLRRQFRLPQPALRKSRSPGASQQPIGLCERLMAGDVLVT
jgi:hypothetical protein